MTAGYLDYSGRDDVLSGGVKLITVDTSKGPFRVWTKRIGNNPSIKVPAPAWRAGCDPRVSGGV